MVKRAELNRALQPRENVGKRKKPAQPRNQLTGRYKRRDMRSDR